MKLALLIALFALGCTTASTTNMVANRSRCGGERCLPGMQTTNTAATSPTNQVVNEIFDAYVRQIEYGEGRSAAPVLNGFFGVLRIACAQGVTPCQDACGRRNEMRRYMARWNDEDTHRFPIGQNAAGQPEVIYITWDDDIDSLCANSRIPAE